MQLGRLFTKCHSEHMWPDGEADTDQEHNRKSRWRSIHYYVLWIAATMDSLTFLRRSFDFSSVIWTCVGRFTGGAVWVGSRWAGQTGGVVAVVVAGVAGRAGLSLPCCRELHSPRHVLHADFWLHPTIQHLRLYPAKPEVVIRVWKISLSDWGTNRGKRGRIETKIHQNRW